MKILILSSTYLPTLGGTERQIEGLCQSLHQKGHQVTLWTHRKAKNIKKNSPYPILLFFPGTLFLFHRFRPLGNLYWKWQCWLRRDVFSNHEVALWIMLYPLGLSIPQIKKHSKIPHGLRACGWDIQKKPELSYGARCISDDVESQISDIITSADFLVSNNEDTKKEYLELGADEKKIISIPNGIFTTPFLTIEKSSKEKFQLLTVGRNHPKKGFSILPEIAKNLLETRSDWEWTVIGGGFEDLQAQVINDGLQNHFKFLGIQKAPRVEEEFKKSDLFIFPTLIETFGSVLLEAQASNTTVVSSNVEGVRNVIQNGENGILCEPQNAIDFSDTILDLMKNEKKRSMLIQKGKENALKHDWNEVAKLYESTFVRYSKNV